MPTPFKTRTDWDARPPKRPASNIYSEGLTGHYWGPSPWTGRIDRSSEISFLATANHDRCAPIIRAGQDYHMDVHGWNDIAYNSGICPHGFRYEMRGPDKRSGANGTNDGNSRSNAIVYIAGVGDPLTELAKLAFHDEAARYGQSLWRNHANWKSTSCAGDPFRAWQAQGFPRPTTDEGDLDLTMAQFEELMAAINAVRSDGWQIKAQQDAIHEALIGTYSQNETDNTAGRSVHTLIKGLAAETIGGSGSDPNSNKSILRRIFEKNKVPTA